MLIWTGLLDPRKPVVLVGGVMATALFMDAANGAAVSNKRLSGYLGSTDCDRLFSTRWYPTSTHNTTVL
jgi:hypothetical protein